jgi:hypothetical protein
MSLSARTPTTLDTNKFVPEIWSKTVEEAAKSNLVAWDAINTQWRSDLTKGDTLYISKTNTVTATEVEVGTKASALNPFNKTAVTLSIDQWYEAPVDIDDMSDFQSQVDLEKYAALEAAYAIKVKIDSTVCDLFSSLGSYSTSAYGSDGQTLSDDILIYLKETLDEADVPFSDRSLIIDPSGLADILKIDKLVSADYVARQGAIENGVIGNSVYGCVVRVTNNLTAVSAGTGSYAAMLHKKALGGAAQIQRSWVERYPELHQTRFQAEALWGVTEVRDDFGVPFYTRLA